MQYTARERNRQKLMQKDNFTNCYILCYRYIGMPLNFTDINN